MNAFHYTLTAMAVLGIVLALIALILRRRSNVRFIVYTRRWGVECFGGKMFRDVYAAKQYVWKRVPVAVQVVAGYTVLPIIKNADGTYTKLSTLSVDVPPRTNARHYKRTR